MKAFYLSILVISLISNKILCETAIICGHVENYKHRAIVFTFKRSDPVGAFLKPEKYKVKTDNNGFFHFSIDNMHFTTYENELKIGSAEIYLMISPKDSIFIDVDRKTNSYSFSGINSKKNILFNELYSDIIQNKTITDYNWLTNSKKFINEFSAQNDIDDQARIELEQFSLCLYYNYFVTTPPTSIDNYEILKKSFIDSFNNNQHLLWYYLYYSAMNGYLEFLDSSKIFLSTDGGLLRALKRAEKYLEGQFLENYKGYIISYTIIWDSRLIKDKKQIQNKQAVLKFIKNCQNEYIKERLEELLKEYRINVA